MCTYVKDPYMRTLAQKKTYSLFRKYRYIDIYVWMNKYKKKLTKLTTMAENN